MIGTDFEEFVHDGYKIASAIGLIGGDKEDPVWCEGGNMQEDNVLAEGATNPASSLRLGEYPVSPSVHPELHSFRLYLSHRALA